MPDLHQGVEFREEENTEWERGGRKTYRERASVNAVRAERRKLKRKNKGRIRQARV